MKKKYFKKMSQIWHKEIPRNHFTQVEICVNYPIIKIKIIRFKKVSLLKRCLTGAGGAF